MAEREETALWQDEGLSDESLFVGDGSVVTQRDVVRALCAVGLSQGDTVLMHSSLLALGRPAMTRESTMASLVNALEHVLGPSGTLAMATYTFSFCKGKTFDVSCSRSTCGALSEYFRCCSGVVRTRHPIYSTAIRGAHTGELVDTNNEDCFGTSSFFGKLHELGGKTLTFGTGFASTFKHYIEQQHGVPYRFFKTFSGKIVDGDGEYETSCRFYVKHLNLDLVKD